MIRPATALLLLALGSSAATAADRPGAEACAAKLSPEAKLIYNAVAPDVTPASVLTDLIPEKVRPMVFAGKLSRSTARANAPSAGECLKLLK